MDYLRVKDVSPDTLEQIARRGLELKSGAISNVLAGKLVALLFEKPSLRTKLSFWAGVQKLGGMPVYFASEEVGLGRREPVADAARVASSMADMIMIRTFDQAVLEDFAANSSVPVINALTDSEHPCQALADMMTIAEVCGSGTVGRLAFVGAGNNVAVSLAYAAAGAGWNFVIASPKGYELPHREAEGARNYGRKNGGTVEQLRLPEEAVAGASVIYTDVWASMGEEAEADQIRRDFKGYQVTPQLMNLGLPTAKFMHDMPAHPGEEISEGMLYEARSVCFVQAENRLWAQAALMEWIANSA